MASVIKSLDAALEMQAVDSAVFFDVAHTGYTQSGRGAIVTMFPNINALESGEKAASFFMPRSELVKFEYADAVSFVDMYDPQQWYVTLAVLTVRQKRMRTTTAFSCANSCIRTCILLHHQTTTSMVFNCAATEWWRVKLRARTYYACSSVLYKVAMSYPI
jgi:hypothetical protein